MVLERLTAHSPVKRRAGVGERLLVVMATHPTGSVAHGKGGDPVDYHETV
jgi:hypothetical protein